MTSKIRKAVFPAAGLGTRFLPATKASPKEMLPLVDKPLIQYSVEEAVASGIESILIITGRDKNSIENHFDISFELEELLKEKGKTEVIEEIRAISDLARISYTRQKQALGLGHAIYQAKDFAGDDPFAALLADDVVDAEKPALKQMIEVFEKYNAPVIATMQVTGEAISRFGVIDADEVEPNVFRIKDMVEKPAFKDAPSDLAIIGRYIFTPDIFDAIEQTQPGAGGEIQITDAMRLLLKSRPLYAVKLEGTRHDAGDKLGFLIATVEFALKRKDLGKEFKEYLKTLNLASIETTGR
jgi:UTP--glucose-1-phosphate uridylyltransferase